MAEEISNEELVNRIRTQVRNLTGDLILVLLEYTQIHDISGGRIDSIDEPHGREFAVDLLQKIARFRRAAGHADRLPEYMQPDREVDE